MVRDTGARTGNVLHVTDRPVELLLRGWGATENF